MTEFLAIMSLPFLACLIFTGMHAYLGLHIIEREVIFVDLALAQIAVLGASLALVFGYGLDSAPSYWLSLGFTIIGAAIFSLTRLKEQKVPLEAIVGITYVVSASLLIIILGLSGEGTEHIRQSLVGNILLVTPKEVIKIFVIYSLIGIIHYIFRRPFYLISRDTAAAYAQGLNVRGWDFLFYVLFGLVVTSSVKIAGVLLVFSFLVIPMVCAMIFSPTPVRHDSWRTGSEFRSPLGASEPTNLGKRLWLSWAIGAVTSLIGMIVSYTFDIPTGASVVCVMGVTLIVLGLIKK